MGRSWLLLQCKLNGITVLNVINQARNVPEVAQVHAPAATTISDPRGIAPIMVTTSVPAMSVAIITALRVTAPAETATVPAKVAAITTALRVTAPIMATTSVPAKVAVITPAPPSTVRVRVPI